MVLTKLVPTEDTQNASPDVVSILLIFMKYGGFWITKQTRVNMESHLERTYLERSCIN